MSKETLTNNLVVAMITILIIIGSYTIYRNLNLIDDKNFWQQKLINIDAINKEIDIRFDRKITLSNYDYLNARIAVIFDIFSEIEKSPNFENFTFSQENALLFEELKSLFRAKQIFIRQYQTLKSTNDSAIYYLNNNIGVTQDIAFNNKIYADILQSKIGFLGDTRKTYREINEQLDFLNELTSKSDQNGEYAPDIEFLTRAREILANTARFNDLERRNRELGIEFRIENLNAQMNDYFKNAVNSIFVPFGIVLASVLFLLVRNLMIHSRNKRLNSRVMSLNAVLSHSPNSIITIDKEGKILDANRAFETISGFHKNEVIGTQIQNLVTNMDQKKRLQRNAKKHK